MLSLPDNSGEFVPQPAYQDEFGTYCREYWQTVTVAGEKQQGFGVACRQSDGTWKLS